MVVFFCSYNLMIRKQIKLITTILDILIPLNNNIKYLLNKLKHNQCTTLTYFLCECLNNTTSHSLIVFKKYLIRTKYSTLINSDEYVSLNIYENECYDNICKKKRKVSFSLLLVNNFFIIKNNNLYPYIFTPNMSMVETLKNLLFVKESVEYNIKKYKTLLKHISSDKINNTFLYPIIRTVFCNVCELIKNNKCITKYLL